MTPETGTVELNPVETVTVAAQGAKLTSVEMTTVDDQGAPVTAAGELSADASQWSTTETLLFHSDYTVSWRAEDTEGVEGTGEFTVSTVSAANEADVALNISEGATYGVGMMIELNFSEPVLNKKEVENAIVVTGGGDQKGAVRWYSDYMARYRPAEHWAPNSAVNIKVNLLGLDIGNGMIGNANVERNFMTGDRRYALADNNTKTIKLWVNGNLVRENPITLGNEDWPSVVGQLVVLEQAEKYYFDSGSLDLKEGDPHYYEPFWATNVSRLTPSGVFVHQALPSAYSSVGVANVSHGCIGMLPADAKFFFDTFGVGDIVETINTGYPQADPDDGFGDWNIPFDKYNDSSWKGNW